jgi:biotin carboxyl carrier protein
MPGLRGQERLRPPKGAFVLNVTSPVTGSVLEISVAIGERVSLGQQLVVLESMKMEFPVEAPRDGTIRAISVEEGGAVQPGDLLLTLE